MDALLYLDLNIFQMGMCQKFVDRFDDIFINKISPGSVDDDICTIRNPLQFLSDQWLIQK